MKISKGYTTKGTRFPEEEIDGVFEKMTDMAVREFQRIHDLKVDSKVGPAIWDKLGYN